MPMKKILADEPTDGGKYFAAEPPVDRFSSGCTVLDCVLGGGWAERRVLNIIGDRSTGKTLLAEEAVANFATKYKDGLIKYRETEKAFDPVYATNLGIPVNRIIFDEEHPCYTIEDFYNDLRKFAAKCKKRNVSGLYILDSLDALSSAAEMDKEFGAASYGGSKAKDMSQLFRMANQEISESNVTLLVISQIRDAIGTMYGPKTKRSGGHALDFYCSQVITLSNLGKMTTTIRGVTRPIGNQIRVRADKMKVGMPYRECEVPVLYSYGMDDLTASIDWLVSVKREAELGLSGNAGGDTDASDTGKKRKESKAVAAFKKALKRLTDSEYVAERNRINKVVRRVWEEIENEFRPVRKKYG